MIFGHRGARAHAPENTLESFALALRLGATGLESDVWLTADGVPVLDHDGVVQGSLAERTPRIVPDGRTFSYVVHTRPDGAQLRITQNDVRAIQLAKAALRAGIELLMQHAGLTELSDIRLAGAFGSHIDPTYALVLGLVPDCPVIVLGGAGGRINGGRVLDYKEKPNRQLCRLFLSLMDKMYVHPATFGDATAMLEEV